MAQDQILHQYYCLDSSSYGSSPGGGLDAHDCIYLTAVLDILVAEPSSCGLILAMKGNSSGTAVPNAPAARSPIAAIS